MGNAAVLLLVVKPGVLKFITRALAAVGTIWLKYFQFGPAEWVWRSLTYWKRQPMRLIT